MSANHVKRGIALATLTATIATLALAGGAQAASPPVKLELTGHIAHEFVSPVGVAVNTDAASPEYGDVYVADKPARRIQVFDAAGAFVSMFGWEVNATKQADPTATQAEKNVCTAASGDVCQAGVGGFAGGQFDKLVSLAVDPASGDVYVAENVESNSGEGLRVQKFTPEGRFLLELGKEVNATKKTNLCTAEEAEKGADCEGPAQETPGSSESGAFNFEWENGDLLAAGGTEDLLYVGEEHRIQEFKADGEPAGEISLGAISEELGDRVQALALDQETGDLYVSYPQGSSTIHGFSPAGAELTSFPVDPGRAGGAMRGLAVDSEGHLAVMTDANYSFFSALYAAVDGHLLTTVTLPQGTNFNFNAIAFGPDGTFYVSNSSPGEVLAYTAKPVAELTLSPPACKAGLGSEASVVFACALSGEVNPEGVAGTEALFEWGRSPALGEKTALQKVQAPGTVQAVVDVPPHATSYFQLAGYDQNVQAPEQLATEETSVSEPAVAPRVLGALSALDVSSSSAVLSGELNPENTNTTYRFEYAPACVAGEACPAIAQTPGMAQTASQESGVYGATGAVSEATGLQPASSYRFQLLAVNEDGEAALDESGGAALPEATFTTAPAPVPAASSGVASAVGVSTATISGTVDPDGLPATYSFELGVYEGAGTQYGIVSSGLAGSGSVPLEETLGLNGLQPGKTYAFRISVHSGYIHNSESTVYGAAVPFTTSGLPSGLTAPTPLAQLPVPAIAFPKPPKGTTQGSGKKKAKRKQRKHKAGKGKRKHKGKGTGKGRGAG